MIWIAFIKNIYIYCVLLLIKIHDLYNFIFTCSKYVNNTCATSRDTFSYMLSAKVYWKQCTSIKSCLIDFIDYRQGTKHLDGEKPYHTGESRGPGVKVQTRESRARLKRLRATSRKSPGVVERCWFLHLPRYCFVCGFDFPFPYSYLIQIYSSITPK